MSDRKAEKVLVKDSHHIRLLTTPLATAKAGGEGCGIHLPVIMDLSFVLIREAHAAHLLQGKGP